MKFTHNEISFAFENWAVTIYRSRHGNRTDGFRYLYSFTATECIKDGNRFKIGAKLSGRGTKRNAISEIKKIKKSA